MVQEQGTTTVEGRASVVAFETAQLWPLWSAPATEGSQKRVCGDAGGRVIFAGASP